MTLGVALPLLYPYARDFFALFLELLKHGFTGFLGLLSTLLLTAYGWGAMSFASLSLCLVWKGLFGKDAKCSRRLILFPLFILAFLQGSWILLLLHHKVVEALKAKNLTLLKSDAQGLVSFLAGSYFPYKSLTAEYPEKESLIYKPFTGPLRRMWIKMNPVGCFMTFLTIIWPAMHVINYIVNELKIVCPSLSENDWNEYHINLLLITLTLFSAANSVLLFVELGSYLQSGTHVRPYLRGLTTITTPGLFFFLLKRLNGLNQNAIFSYNTWDKKLSLIKAFQGFDNLKVFCFVSFVLGLVGYIGYVADPSSRIGMIYRTFVAKDDEDVKTEGSTV